MPSDNAAKYIGHIIEATEKIDRFIGGRSEDEFLHDEMAFDAVVRNLEIISEASRRIPDPVKERHPEIRWRAVAGLGNIYRHDYVDVSETEVWKAATIHLPALVAALRPELDDVVPG